MSAQMPFIGENGKVGFKDQTGKVVIPCKFAEVHPSGFSEGLCAVKKKSGIFSKWGFIDTSGKLAIKYKYSSVHHGFSEGLCGVWYGMLKSGYINKSGKVVIKLDDLVHPGAFKKGRAKVTLYSENGVETQTIDRNTRRVKMQTSDPGVPPEASLSADELLAWLHSNDSDYIKDQRTTVSVDRKPGMIIDIKEPLPNPIKNKAKPSQGKSANTDEEPAKEVPIIPSQPTLNGFAASDVDRNIPLAEGDNSNTFAVIIANENYKRESKVDYALNDGETFRQYCHQALGLPKSNVHCIKDATLNDFRAEMDWLSQVAEAYDGEARLIVYYAGHGVPDEKTRTSYLLPVDGYGSNVNTGYKLSEMYSSLSAYPAKSVMIFLDACFSGTERGGGMLASARGVALKAKPEQPKGNMIVISAASGDETAYKYDEKSHGMFTYFLLKKLQQSGAATTLGELADYLTTNVGRRSIVINMKSQTPTVSVSGSLSSGWRNLTFNE